MLLQNYDLGISEVWYWYMKSRKTKQNKNDKLSINIYITRQANISFRLNNCSVREVFGAGKFTHSFPPWRNSWNSIPVSWNLPLLHVDSAGCTPTDTSAGVCNLSCQVWLRACYGAWKTAPGCNRSQINSKVYTWTYSRFMRKRKTRKRKKDNAWLLSFRGVKLVNIHICSSIS